MKRLLALLGAFGIVVGSFELVVRPWYSRWGATPEEAQRLLPGDEIVPNATVQETRAITIRAPVERVWPWVAQLGQDRGGFYSYDLLENLVGCAMPTVDRLQPDKQAWRLGDKLWMYPPEKAGGIGFATLRTYLPGQALGFGTHAMGTAAGAPEDGSWAFIVEPASTTTTRLLVRGRGAAGRSLLGRAFDRSIFEPVHFVMERRTMIGIRQLAEGSDRNRTANHLQIGLWAITFGLLVWSAILVLLGRRWQRSLVAFLAACAVFQVLTLAQPGLLFGALLVTGVAALTLLPSLPRATPRAYRPFHLSFSKSSPATP